MYARARAPVCVCVCVCVWICSFINRKTLTDTSMFQYAGVLSIFPHNNRDEDLPHRSSCYDVLCDSPLDISESERASERERVTHDVG